MRNRKNTRTCKFNWNALTWREWMWNAIFIEAVFQTEDLLGNTIRSLAPHLITLKWGVTLFSKFFQSRKGDQVHFETTTTRLEQNSMIMSRDSSVRLKDITLVFRRKLEVVLMKNLWTPSCSWKMLHSTLDGFFPKFLDVTNTAILFRPKWSNEYWNHLQEVAVKLEDSLQIKVQNIRDWNDVLLEIMGGVLTWKFLDNQQLTILGNSLRGCEILTFTQLLRLVHKPEGKQPHLVITIQRKQLKNINIWN